MERERIKFKIKFFISLCTSRFCHFINKILRKMSSCLFKFCGAKKHDADECLRSAKTFYQRKYYGSTYNVCPECEIISNSSFEDFLKDHRTHLSYFKKSKLDIIKIGKLFIYYYFITFIFLALQSKTSIVSTISITTEEEGALR